MKNFVKFLVGPWGRGIRIAAGLILIIIGALLLAEINWVVIVIGLIPLSAGIFDFCIFAPFLGYYFSGEKTRNKVNSVN